MKAVEVDDQGKTCDGSVLISAEAFELLDKLLKWRVYGSSPSLLSRCHMMNDPACELVELLRKQNNISIMQYC